MKRIPLLILILLLPVGCQTIRDANFITKRQRKAKMNTTTESAAIEKIVSLYGEIINTADVTKTLALFTADGVIMPNGAPLSKGQEQLRAAYEGLYNAFQLAVKYMMEEVAVNGDYAYARTSSKGKSLIRGTGDTVPVDNKELFVLHKEAGQWKIAQYIFNGNKMR